MDQATISLIQAAFSLGKEILDIIGDKASSEAATNERLSKVETFLKDSMEGMESSIDGAAQLIIDKIETDKLEQLLSRTRNLSMLVDLQKPDQALQYAMTLRESLDYARNRVQEDKPYWLGPYLGGYAIFLGGLEYCKSCPLSEVEEFRGIVEKTKIEILNIAAPLLLASGRILPWLEITSFLSNEISIIPSNVIDAFEHLEGIPLVSVEESIPSTSLVASLANEHLRGKNGIYLSPNIPDKKLKGATTKLLSLADPEDKLIGLIDTTVFGGAADGVAIFEEYIVYSNISENGCRYSYVDLKNPPAEKSWQSIKAGGKTMKLYDSDIAKSFALFLKSVCEE